MADKKLEVPDIGDAEDVDVVEILVKPGAHVEPEQGLIVLESDKASMEIPAPEAGVIKELKVSVGDKVSQGSLIAILEPESDSASEAEPESEPESERKPEPEPESEQEPEPEPERGRGAVTASAAANRTVPPPPLSMPSSEPAAPERKPHATPSVRKLARELGVDLAHVPGTGRKGRILKEDVQGYVKHAMATAGTATGSGFAFPELPEIDFSQFGEVSFQPLTKIQKVSGRNLHRSWVSIPHVTQFDEADITELEEFRKKMRAEKPDVKLTLTSFFMKAVVVMLRQMPRFNASLDPSGENLVLKHYFHVGVAVDTPNGLVVPVIRDVDIKGLHDLASELADVSERARARKLAPKDMQGACITISSLGGIGGTHFTPIINPPEVAVLGVSRAALKPAWTGEKFEPRLMCGLSLSYDHRVIDGADAVRFTTKLREVLSDIRQMLL
ncbi:MAG: dihydrolipoyllysine-residue acetyltransferase [Myxococcales bacterium]|jgi:pyruvate dehydrogenase E2 component (dihydrolipoamide acetyltransferase)